MMPLHLDYQRSYQPFPTAGAILLAAALLVALQIGRQYLDFGDVLTAWQDRADQLDRLARRQPAGLAGHLDRDQTAREVARANEVLRRVTLPWDALFRAVESAASKDIALLAMEPDSDKQTLKVAGEAKDVAAMLAYLRTLESSPMFRSVLLQSHQIQQQDPQRPIRFALVAAWKDRP